MPILTHNRTVASHFVRAALQGAKRQGEDIEMLLNRVGIPLSMLTEPRARVSFEQYARLIQLLWQHLDDELLGFGREPVLHGSFAMLCRAIIHSRTLGQALRRASRYYGLMQGGHSHLRLAREGEWAQLIIDESGFDDPDHFLTETLLVTWHRFSSWLIGQRIALQEVSFAYPAPAHQQEYNLIYGAPLHFEAERTSLCFTALLLDAPVVQDEGSLRIFLRNSAHELLWRREHGRQLSAQVRRSLGQGADGPGLDLPAAAAKLAMSPQTLRRHLLQEGTTFLAIKNQWRRDLAISLLAETTLSIAEIARRTGFSEASAFHRAFKSWTGLLPSAYRA